MKKVICLILSLILVLGMAVTAFAVDGTVTNDPTQQPGNYKPEDTDDPNDPTFNPAPNNPRPGDTFNPAPNNRHRDRDYVNPGVTEIDPEDFEEEANPNTGAPVSMLPLVFVALGAVAAVGKRK